MRFGHNFWLGVILTTHGVWTAFCKIFSGTPHLTIFGALNYEPKYGQVRYLGNNTALTLKIEIRAISALLLKAVNLWPNLKLGKNWVAKKLYSIRNPSDLWYKQTATASSDFNLQMKLPSSIPSLPTKPLKFSRRTKFVKLMSASSQLEGKCSVMFVYPSHNLVFLMGRSKW